MPVLPSLLDRLLFFDFNLGPAPLFDLFGAMAFRTVLSAVRLGVFDVLASGTQTAAQVAQQIGADERGMKVLLEALQPLGYVSRKNGGYTNTPMTARWLVHSSPDSIAAGFDFWGMAIVDLWGNLEESIRTGQPPLDFYTWIEAHPEASKKFQELMAAITRLVSDEIIAKLKIPPTTRRVLDVGGGHGMYSIALCRRYPQLTANILDAPQALEAARQNIAAQRLGDRITVQEANFLQDDLGKGYDLALVFNIIHGFSPQQNTDLFCRVAAALQSAGRIAVAEQLVDKVSSPTGRASTAMFGLNYFHLFGSGVFTFEQVAAWLEAAGFKKPHRMNLLRAPGNGLIVATRI